MKSNISIRSNIYNRSSDNISRDQNYVSQVRGRELIKQIKSKYCLPFSSVRLSPWQEEVYKIGVACAYAKNNEITHGMVKKDGINAWEGRCEYSNCFHFSTCKSKATYVRKKEFTDDEDTLDSISGLTYKWLDYSEKEHSTSKTGEKVLEEKVSKEKSEESNDEKCADRQKEYVEISDPNLIITADINSKILVNAAPGSGKTYTAIKRLEYIIKNQKVENYSEILVLVYTNAAKNEILDRLNAGISNGELPFTAQNVDLCTFDSLATNYLVEIQEEFYELNYDERIRLFNKRINKSDFSHFAYVIIDELQDLVNERAKMALNILCAIQCGCLLLGDRCQAIYDYESQGDTRLNSEGFYQELNKILSDNVLKYEMKVNYRQSSELQKVSTRMRNALLSSRPTEANKVISVELENIETLEAIDKFDFSSIHEKAAILCRSNGEAEYVSHLLYRKHIPHLLLRGVNQPPTLSRHIADCLWDYKASPEITRETFVNRYCARVAFNKELASKMFDALSEAVYNRSRESIELDKLTQRLCRSKVNLPSVLINENSSSLTVSTIHKAKGREFETVFLLDRKFNPQKNDTEEARVWYVGCTRAKQNLYKIKQSKSSWRFARSHFNNMRWTKISDYKQKVFGHGCERVVLGLPFDFSEAGFVAGDLESALKKQEYISKSVNAGDKVMLELDNNKYQIIHKNRNIGYLADNIFQELKKTVRGRRKMPARLSPLYVANIITITPFQFHDNVPVYFRESKFWLGVELTGFPIIYWSKKENDDE